MCGILCCLSPTDEKLNSFSDRLEKMKNRNNGHIVTISSLASLRGMPQAASYSSSKSALNKTIESFRIDLKNFNIKFTNVFPGFIKTQMTNHDEFEMPFMVDVEDAAKKIIKVIEKKKMNYYFPFAIAILSLFNKVLPVSIFSLIMRKFASDDNKEPKIF